MADVLVETGLADDGLVAEIRLNRVDARNALSTGLATELIEAAGVIRRSRARAVVLASAAPAAFCVGADLKERPPRGSAGVHRAPRTELAMTTNRRNRTGHDHNRRKPNWPRPQPAQTELAMTTTAGSRAGSITAAGACPGRSQDHRIRSAVTWRSR